MKETRDSTRKGSPLKTPLQAIAQLYELLSNAMRGLELHPKFQDLKEVCLKFPEHSEQLFQVYLDLTEAKDFEDVGIIQSPLLRRCLIEGTHPDNAQKFLILPSFITELWSVAKLELLFSTLSEEQDTRLSTAALSRITLGVISADSTITYMNLYRGVPPENAQSGSMPLSSLPGG